MGNKSRKSTGHRQVKKACQHLAHVSASCFLLLLLLLLLFSLLCVCVCFQHTMYYFFFMCVCVFVCFKSRFLLLLLFLEKPDMLFLDQIPVPNLPSPPPFGRVRKSKRAQAVAGSITVCWLVFSYWLCIACFCSCFSFFKCLLLFCTY